ncbi:MAG: hypothetical protein U9O64_02455 [Campylobacterota bacterium]|nr:hypothetical protein [Campylobacterota bacterium]
MRIKKIIIVLICLSSILLSQQISFKELTKLASQDLQKNIYLDKDIKDYKVEFNIVDHQKRGEIYEFYKIVLFDNDLFLQYNKNGNFYFITQKNEVVEPTVLPPKPIPFEEDKIRYYSYKIKNITNQDVVNTMKIFPDIVKYVHLQQSDMIAYSATKEQHTQIKTMLRKSDNKSREALVKITLFATQKDKLISYGSKLEAFNFNLDSSYVSILDTLISQKTTDKKLNYSANFGFTLFALAGHGAVDIYQEPTIRVTNGKEATVTSGQTIGYKESTITYQENTQTSSEQIKYRDVGIKIKVFPKIKDNWVHLDLNIISEELLSLEDNIPLTQKITYQSSVTVKKKQPVLLTGIKKTSMKYERDGIPLLQDLPYIGELFKSQTKQNENQTINILIEVL